MAKKSPMMQKVGSWAFIIGIIIAIIAGFAPLNAVVTGILVFLGLLVGFLNITAKESNTFLFTALVLVVVADFGGGKLVSLTPILKNMLDAIIVFIVPATLIVSFRAIYQLAKN